MAAKVWKPNTLLPCVPQDATVELLPYVVRAVLPLATYENTVYIGVCGSCGTCYVGRGKSSIETVQWY